MEIFGQLSGYRDMCGLQLFHNFVDESRIAYLKKEYGENYVNQRHYMQLSKLDQLGFRGPGGPDTALHTGLVITAIVQGHKESWLVENYVKEHYPIINETSFLKNHNSGNMFKTIIFKVKDQDGSS